MAPKTYYINAYPFGSVLGGRNGNVGDYRFSINGQEKVDEISGAGNHTTAQYWEYDTRLGRRWNLDPVDQVSVSNYAVFYNNPNLFTDPLGNTATKYEDEAGKLLGEVKDGRDQTVIVNKEQFKSAENFARSNGLDIYNNELHGTRFTSIYESMSLIRSDVYFAPILSSVDILSESTSNNGFNPDFSTGISGSFFDLMKNMYDWEKENKLLAKGRFLVEYKNSVRNWPLTQPANQYFTEAWKQSQIAKFVGKANTKIALSNALEVLGRTANILGLGYSLVKIASGDKKRTTKVDAVAGGIAFVPGVGWIISLGHFGTSAIVGEENMEFFLGSIEEGQRFVYDWNKDPSHDATMKIICFAKGTLILTNKGSKPIEIISVKDSVYSYDVSRSSITLDLVSKIFKRESPDYYKVYTKNEVICVTSEHPFYLNKNTWVKAKDLKEGDLLFTFDANPIKIINIEYIKNPIDVYNIEVKNNHTYFITLSKILVHNKEILDE